MSTLSHHALLYQGRVLTDTPIDVGQLRATTEVELVHVPILSIGLVRELTLSAYARPFEKASKTIVIEVGQIAPEAQQALLKLLEEPPATTNFILVLPSFENLLPTLRSRVFQPTDTRPVVAVSNPLFSAFLASPYGERITQIGELAKAKDTSDFELLAAGLRDWLTTTTLTPLAVRLHEWLLVLPKRGAAKKMLWEDIALVLPVVR